MFAKANKAYESTAPTRPSNHLSKALFPSSSPKKLDGDIRQQLKKQSAATTTPRLNAQAQTPTPLVSISANAASNIRGHAAKPAGPGKLASLYSSHADPFKENSPSKSGAVMSTSSAPAVHLYEEDFDDEFYDDFELECVQSLALPALPTVATPNSAKNPIVIDDEIAPSWATSTPSHLEPPAKRTSSSVSVVQSLKRHSSDEAELVHHTVPKKRALPKHWTPQADEPEIKVVQMQPSTARSQPAMPWDVTPITYQEQKERVKANRLREQVQNDEGLPSHGSRQTLEQVTRAHAAKAVAISLSQEQQKVLDLVLGHNQSVFFTGPAGTGKSVLMRSIISELKKKYASDPGRIAVTASTGLAACNIGGITLHSFSGIGIGKDDVTTLVKRVRKNQKAKARWLKTKCLVIDEISMVDGDLWDKLDEIARRIRNNGRPWGGIQLVITGDFFQLPPVPDNNSRMSKFAFDAATWNTSIEHTIGLTQVFRQRDPKFATMLNEMRLGKISDDTVATFQSLSRPLTFTDGISQTELFPTRAEVESSNERRLRDLQGASREFPGFDTGDIAVRDRLLQNMMAPKTLMLKLGAQVMLVKNLDENLVNGTLGKVVAFSSTAAERAVDEEEEGSKPKNKFKPYAHKAETSFSGGGREYPVVDFSLANGTVQTVLCEPHEFTVELPDGKVQASRKQLPLILAWALSIHKAQGQTLERVKVDLGRVFEKGQAYVALSRATTQHGLQVIGFERSKVMAHPRVVEFYGRLSSADSAVASRQHASRITSYAAKAPSAGYMATINVAKTAAGSNYRPSDVDGEDSIFWE